MRILLAIDGSKQSIEAAYFLSRLPLPETPEVTVVTVLNDEHFALRSAHAQTQTRASERRSADDSFLLVDAILKPRKIAARHEVIVGHPKRNILKAAETMDADLIVLGDHGHSALARALLGSTSDFVVNHSRCSVLMVRSTLRPEGSGDDSFNTLLAYDGSAGSRLAASELFGLNWNSESKIRVAMILARPKLQPDDEIYDEPGVQQAEQSAAALVREAECSRCQAKIEYVVREAVHVGSGITSLLRDEPCHMVCVGGTGKSEISKFFLGCVSRHVLHHANCSVWIAREKGWHH